MHSLSKTSGHNRNTSALSHDNEIPELSTKQEEIRRILLGALGHFLSSVAQLVEAVVDISNQLSACRELSLNVGREIFLRNRLYHRLICGKLCTVQERFFHWASVTNLCLGCSSVGHELITCFLVRITQLSLNILFGKKSEEWVRGNRMHFVVNVGTTTLVVQQLGFSKSTYGAVKGEKGLDQLVLGEEGVPRHQVDKPAEASSPTLNKVPLRDRGQDYGHISEDIISVWKNVHVNKSEESHIT